MDKDIVSSTHYLLLYQRKHQFRNCVSLTFTACPALNKLREGWYVYCGVTILVVDTISKQRIKRNYWETSGQGLLPGSVYDKLTYEFMISCIDVVSWSRVSCDSHHCVHNQRASRLNEVRAKCKLGYQRVWSYIWGRWI